MGAHCNLSPCPGVGSGVQAGCGGCRLWAGCLCLGGCCFYQNPPQKKMNFPSPGDAQCLLQVTQTLDDCREKSQKEENSEKQPNRSRETGKRLLQKSQIQKGKKTNLQAQKNPMVIVPQIPIATRQGRLGSPRPHSPCPRSHGACAPGTHRCARHPTPSPAAQAEGPSPGDLSHDRLFLELSRIF